MPPPNEPGRASALEEALGARGLAFTVEVRGGLAVLTPARDRHRPVSAEDRQALLELARAHGFSHAALELPPGG